MDQSESDTVISDHFFVDGTLTSVKFSGDGNLRWSERSLKIERDVIGVSMEGSRIRIRCVINSEGGCMCSAKRESLVRKDFVFQARSEELLKLWYQKLQEHLDSLGRPKRLLVFVNPYGGKKSASKVFVDIVKPLLHDADVQFTLMETKYQLQAKEVAHGLDLTKYDGVVCVSGDGILVEVVNGFLQREDWATAIKMPVGVVPAGTGNGMAKSLLDSAGEPCSALNAVVAIIRGHKQSLDVATISQGSTRFFSVLMLAWGLVADIDIESEKWRWMGSARIDLYAIERILHLRKYLGRIYFVPAPGYENYVEKISRNVESIREVPFENPSEEDPSVSKHHYTGPYLDMDNVNWRTMEGPFISLWIHSVPWGGEDIMPAPDAKFSDGYLDVVLVKDCPKLGLLSLMSNLSNGTHIRSPHVFYFKVKAFVLEPGPRTEDPTKGGIIDSDGEVLARGTGTYMSEEKSLMAYDKLQIAVHQGLATLFCPLQH